MSLSIVAGLRAAEELSAAEERFVGFGPPLGAFPPLGADAARARTDDGAPRRGGVRVVPLRSLNVRAAGGGIR